MTATDPQPLHAALTDALADWPRITGQPVPVALFCAEAHPIDQSSLCSRLAGHTGLHVAGDDDDWGTDDDPKETR